MIILNETTPYPSFLRGSKMFLSLIRKGGVPQE